MKATSTTPPGRRSPARTRVHKGGEDTRGRLLDAAERLFAERGIDAVAIRDITHAAGANTAAIHYHFGSKFDLVVAVLERRAEALGERRAELLDELGGRRRLELRAVVEAVVVPTAELAASGTGGRSYVAVLAALGSHPELMPVLGRLFGAHTARALETLAAVTPELSDDVRVQRFAVSKELVNRVLGHPDGQLQLWLEVQRPGSEAVTVDGLVDIVVGILQAPVTGAGRPRGRRRA